MSRKKMLKEDLIKGAVISERLVLTINEAADISAEYYRRHQLESNAEDMDLSNQWRDIVTSLKAVEDKTCERSALFGQMSSRVDGEPGRVKSLFGFRGKSEQKALRGKEPDDYVIDGSKHEGVTA